MRRTHTGNRHAWRQLRCMCPVCPLVMPWTAAWLSMSSSTGKFDIQFCLQRTQGSCYVGNGTSIACCINSLHMPVCSSKLLPDIGGFPWAIVGMVCMCTHTHWFQFLLFLFWDMHRGKGLLGHLALCYKF